MPNRTEPLHIRESDALAAMMGADSRRIDDLVGAVGEVRGDVSHLRGDVTRVVKGVDDLREAMTVLSRHAVLMETQARDMDAFRSWIEAIDARVQTIETSMPSLIEFRTYAVRGIVGLMGVVGLALLALVMRKP